MALLIAESTAIVELTMIYTAMPTLARVFGGTADVGWVVTASLLVAAAAAALGGRLGDMYGRRRILLAILVISGVGSLISAICGNLPGVIAGSAVQGASAAILPLCVSLVRERMPPKDTPLAVGLVLTAATGAAALGLVVGGFMIDHFGWASIFYVSAASAFTSVLAVRLLVARGAPRPASGRSDVDMVRGVLFAPAIAGILLAVTKAAAWGFTNPRTLGLAAASILLLAYWARHQLRQKTPLIDLWLLANRQLSLAYLCMTLFALGISQHTLLMMMFMQQPTSTLVGFGLSASLAGAALMPVRLIGLVASPVSGILCGRYSPRLTLILGAVTALAGWAVIAVGHASFAAVIVGMLMEGWGFQMIYVGVPIAVVQVVPEDRTGEATGVAQVFRAVGVAVGAQLVMVLLASSKVASHPGGAASYPSLDGYMLVFGFIVFTAALCGAAAWALPQGAQMQFLRPQPQ